MDGTAAALRASLDHPIVDGDGHLIEYFPALAGYLRAEGVDPAGPSIQRLLPGRFGPDEDWYAATPEDRARLRIARPPWWGAPATNTRDLATALFPSLLHERLDELGIDVSVVYPSMGLAFLHLEDPDERIGACRALNRYCQEQFAPFRDRLVPVAAVPMGTPAEAIEVLEDAVDLGFGSVLMAGYVQRTVEGVPEDAKPWARWLDTYGLDSAHDYDPVWAKARDLRLPIAFHSGSIGWGSRISPSNYMFNHIGHLAEGQHTTAKSLFLGGVTRRFPELRFAFLEGGVTWAASLLADLIGHWEKRNVEAMRTHLDPSNIDKALLFELLAEHAPKVDLDPAMAALPKRVEDDSWLDEFAACGIERAEDIVDLFATPYFFGCEADDPMVRTAFDTAANPFGARLQAVFGSDIAHWDVPDMAGVLHEAHELVDHGLIGPDDFRDFTFTNPVRFFTDVNPGFFDGTVVADTVRAMPART